MIVGFGGCTDINNDEINNTNGEINNIFLGKWENINYEPDQEGYFYKYLTFYSDWHGEFVDWVNYTSSIKYEFNETHLDFTIIVDSEESYAGSYKYNFTNNDTFDLTIGNKIIQYKKL